MIHFNSPDHVQERANVEPLSLNDMRQLVEHFNMISHMRTVLGHEQLQRLVWEYENLKHLQAIMPDIAKFSEIQGKLSIVQSDMVIYPKWISVDDALPEIEVPVLFVTNMNYVSQGYLTRGNIYWNETFIGNEYSNVTHWMPLPTPPKV